ncbi:pilus assembly protein TadG-related protein [Bradyrhizobium jicamae]|uniref:pilus assembly protein TadG-related protein n=1 Tax=Bradyrhizobium jicamae TaxID=280332 RepID=UPI001BA91B8E|nr:pilus assembly protein TadG-related protein [Bradyrhizobium jicamae]MBR0939092.1 hypothetical protein [Bradyrhizobium jicamae]
MKRSFKRFFPWPRFAESDSARRLGPLTRLLHDEDGSIIVYMTIAVPVFVGIAALATEGGFWLYQKRMLQSAADNAAYSAAAAYAANTASDITSQARSITANDYNLVNGQNNVTVAVNRPPSGSCYGSTSNYTGNNAIEVIVTKPQVPALSGIWLKSNVSICGRGVAIVPSVGDCILALAGSGAGISTVAKINNLNITLTNCSIFSNSTSSNSITINGNNNVLSAEAIGTAGGIVLNGNSKSTIFNSSTGDPPVADPYATAAASWPTSQTAPTLPAACSGCSTPQTPPTCAKKGPTTITLSPGTYAAAPVFTNCTTVTMSAGGYIFSAGLTVPSGVTLNIGAASTIVVTTGGFNNAGIVNFGTGNYNIKISAGGWANTGTMTFGSGNYTFSSVGNGATTPAWNLNGTTNFGTGNYTFTLTGNWNIGTATTLGNGNYTFAIAGDLTTNANFTMGSGTNSGSMVNWNIQGTSTTIGPGIYYLSGNFEEDGTGHETVTGTGATLVLTGTSSVVLYNPNNSTLNLTAPTASGWNQGIAIWEPNSTGSNMFAQGNSSIANITGVIYAPNADIQYLGNTGSTPNCTQIISKTVELGGNSIGFTGNCTGVPGVKTFGQVAALVE